MNNYIANLKLRGKFLLIAIAMLIPIGGLTFLAGRTELANISFAQSEDEGLDWATSLIDIAANLSEYREHAIAVAGGAGDERAEMTDHAQFVRDAAARLDQLMKDGNEQFIEASTWQAFRPRVAESVAGDGSDAAHLRAGPALIAELHEKVQTMSEVSGLLLDPGNDTFPLMSSVLFDIPGGVESLASARRAMDLVVGGDTSISTHMALAADARDARTRLGSAMHYLVDSYGEYGSHDSKLPADAKQMRIRLDEAFATLENASRLGLGKEVAHKLSNDVELLTENLTELRTAASTELSELLTARAKGAKHRLAGQTGLVVLFIVLAFFIQARVTRQIGGKLDSANGVFGKLVKGEFDSEIGAQSSDELGALMTSLGAMQSGLAARVDADRKAADMERARAVAGERIKQALDSSSVNVVVADEQADIIYVNPAAQRLMSGAAADFRQVSPRFDAGQIVGSNLEVFYSDGARQRDAIAALRQSATSESVVGSRTFQTIASPIVGPDGKRIGTVIEWVDRTVEVATEKEIGNLVSAVSDGKLDVRVSLTGKQGFFEALANGLNGLVTSVDEVVAELQGLVKSANDGDLTRSMQLAGKPGLFVSIGTGVNALVGNMASVVSQVKSVASEVHTGAEEIAKGNTNLSQRTEEQASSLEETASSMEEMTSTVKQTADNAGQANQLAMAARQQAEKGGAVVGTAVTAMGAINDASKKIADIIGVIDEIAFQTNLLALNAAVEAARAGEQGRGFAVVATEVRNLAGRSATAAKEIKALIQDSVAKVDEGSRLVDESGKTLEEIVMAVKKVTDIVAEIAAASREQSSGIEQVNKAVVQMDETTQQNAALVEEAAAASQAIVEQAQQLNSFIAKYKVADLAHGATRDVKPAPRAAERRAPQRAFKKPAAEQAVARAPAPARKVANGASEWSEF